MSQSACQVNGAARVCRVAVLVGVPRDNFLLNLLFGLKVESSTGDRGAFDLHVVSVEGG